VNLARIDLNDIIATFEKFLLRLLREDIDFKKILTNVALPIMADRGQLEQVLMNLVTNSRDAMPQGGSIIIETDLVQADQSFVKDHGFNREGNYALLSVTDTGIGIPETIKDKIFEPFFTTKEEGKGTGLGLSMVYGIVKKHEGYINVYSQTGIGTTIKVYLPMTRVATEAEPQKKDEQNSVRGGAETVLIAEDNASVRSLTTTVLRNFGYTVIEAVDGFDAVNKFRENRDRIRLVILDGIMPKMNGKAAWTEIKALSSGIKAIFLSGYAEDIFTKDGIPDREASFIQKPYPPLVLVRRVRELLDE
jgi:CheY-like chemotaxis protein